MSALRPEERIAQLRARGQAQRLAAQLALLEARAQLAPLRSTLGAVRGVARILSGRSAAGGTLGAAAHFGIAHPSLLLAVGGIVWRALRRRPVGLLLAVGLGAAAWWLLRPAPARSDGAPEEGE
jgi:hypothetical protein